MRLTNYQLVEIIGNGHNMDDFVERSLSLFMDDDPTFDLPKGKYKPYSFYDYARAQKVLNIFSGDKLEKLSEFRKYFLLMLDQMRNQAQRGSVRYDGAITADKFVMIIDKIISGEWTWKFVAPRVEEEEKVKRAPFFPIIID